MIQLRTKSKPASTSCIFQIIDVLTGQRIRNPASNPKLCPPIRDTLAEREFIEKDIIESITDNIHDGASNVILIDSQHREDVSQKDKERAGVEDLDAGSMVLPMKGIDPAGSTIDSPPAAHSMEGFVQDTEGMAASSSTVIEGSKKMDSTAILAGIKYEEAPIVSIYPSTQEPYIQNKEDSIKTLGRTSATRSSGEKKLHTLHNSELTSSTRDEFTGNHNVTSFPSRESCRCRRSLIVKLKLPMGVTYDAVKGIQHRLTSSHEEGVAYASRVREQF